MTRSLRYVFALSVFSLIAITPFAEAFGRCRGGRRCHDCCRSYCSSACYGGYGYHGGCCWGGGCYGGGGYGGCHQANYGYAGSAAAYVPHAWTGPTMAYSNVTAPTVRQSMYGDPSVGPARLRVILPNADARLIIGDTPTQQTGVERVFESPAIQAEVGKRLTYTIQATWMENGREVTRQREVDVNPNQEVVVNFQTPDVPVANP